MQADEMFAVVLDALRVHLQIPDGYTWLPLTAAGVVGLFGLLLAVRGAAWAPGFAAVMFLGLGGVGGAALSNQISMPLWPTAGVGGVVGLILGLTMFRFWQSLLLGACCTAAGLGTYYVSTLHPEVSSWMKPPLADAFELAPAGTIVVQDGAGSVDRLSGLFAHLSANVPHFAVNFWSILGSTALAGILFGWFLPRASRVLWASTLGTLFLGAGAAGLLQQFFPTQLEGLLANNTAAWSITGTIWLTAMAYNVLTCKKKKDSSTAEPEGKGSAKPAVA